MPEPPLGPSPFIRTLRLGDILDITPGVGHVHLRDLPTDRGIKTWRPVSLANDITGERFRIGENTPISETLEEYQRLWRQ